MLGDIIPVSSCIKTQPKYPVFIKSSGVNSLIANVIFSFINNTVLCFASCLLQVFESIFNPFFVVDIAMWKIFQNWALSVIARVYVINSSNRKYSIKHYPFDKTTCRFYHRGNIHHTSEINKIWYQILYIRIINAFTLTFNW